MGIIKMGTLAQETAKLEQQRQEEFEKQLPVKESIYLIECFFAKDKHDDKYNYDYISLGFKILKSMDGSPVKNINNELPDYDVVIWDKINPMYLGYNYKKKEYHKARVYLTALFNVGLDDAIPEDLSSNHEGIYLSLVNKQCKAFIKLEKTEDGKYRNKIGSISPLEDKVIPQAPKSAGETLNPEVEDFSTNEPVENMPGNDLSFLDSNQQNG